MKCLYPRSRSAAVAILVAALVLGLHVADRGAPGEWPNVGIVRTAHAAPPDNEPRGRTAVAIVDGGYSVQSPDSNAAIMDGVRAVYDGPLVLARDLMVINVTKRNIEIRMATVDEYVLPPDVRPEYIKAPGTDPKSPSKDTLKGKWDGYEPSPMPKRGK
jgi:hypothetical protein